MADMETDVQDASSDQGIDGNEVPTGNSELPAVLGKRSLSPIEPTERNGEACAPLPMRQDDSGTSSTGRSKRRRNKAPTTGVSIREPDNRKGRTATPESWMYLAKHKLHAARALETAETAFATHGLLPPDLLLERVEGIRLRVDGLQSDYKSAWGNKLTTELRQAKQAIQPFFGRNGDNGGKPLFHTIYVKNLRSDHETRQKLQSILKSHVWQVEGVPPLLVRVDAPEEREPQPILMHTRMSSTEAAEALSQVGLPAKQVTNFGTGTLRVTFFKIVHADKFLKLWAQPEHALRACFPEANPFDLAQVRGDEWMKIRISPALGESSRQFWLDALTALQIPVRGVRHDRRKDGSPLPWCSATVRRTDLGRIQAADIREDPNHPSSISPMTTGDHHGRPLDEGHTPARHQVAGSYDIAGRGARSGSREGGVNYPWSNERRTPVTPPTTTDDRSRTSPHQAGSTLQERGRRSQPSSSTGSTRRGLSATSRVSFMTEDSSDEREERESRSKQAVSTQPSTPQRPAAVTTEQLHAALTKQRDELMKELKREIHENIPRKVNEANEGIYRRLDEMEQGAEENRRTLQQMHESNLAAIADLTARFKHECRAREEKRVQSEEMFKATVDAYEQALEGVLERLESVENRMPTITRSDQGIVKETGQSQTDRRHTSCPDGVQREMHDNGTRKNGDAKDSSAGGTPKPREKSRPAPKSNERALRDTSPRRDPQR